MRLFVPVFLFSLIHYSAANAVEIAPKVIYGEDDRKDIYEVADPFWVERARSTAALFQSAKVSIDASKDVAHLTLTSYAERKKLCANERFYDQSSGAFCSASIVGKDIMITAGHCIKSNSDCLDTKLVLGFGIYSKGATPSDVPSDNVYSCKEIVARAQDDRGEDYAVIRTDREIKGYAPLAINRSRDIEPNTAITVIGHPSGLPTKISGGAKAREINRGYFTANLDTYGGNSGSAVFNSSTGLIEGILVRGETDFVWDTKEKCWRSNVCSDNGCRGEDVTLISKVVRFIPELKE